MEGNKFASQHLYLKPATTSPSRASVPVFFFLFLCFFLHSYITSGLVHRGAHTTWSTGSVVALVCLLAFTVVSP